MNLLRRKSVTDLQKEALTDHSLKRALGALNLTMLGIGAIIGTGIFVLTGTVAALNAGPAVVLSFVLAGVASIFAALCYSEFASLVPMAGSAYTYGYATLGEIFAWIIGWDLVLEYAFGAATVASGWSGTLVSLLQDFGVNLPPQIIGTPGSEFVFFQGRWSPLATVLPAINAAGIGLSGLPRATALFNVPAFVSILIVTTILVIGVKESARFNTVAVFIKVATIVIFIAIAGVYLWQNPGVFTNNWREFIPENKGGFGQFGWSGIARGASVIFFAYIGFDAVTTAAQEAKNPQRDMPIGLLGSLAICTILFLVVSAVLTGVMHYSQLNVAAPVALAIGATGVKWGSLIVNLGILAGLRTVMLVMLLA